MAVSDETVVPVVRVAYLDFILPFADGGRDIHLPRGAPNNAAIGTIHEYMRKASRNIAEGEIKV